MFLDLNLIFFFQAEDGIRDKLVTGVQTCALPIYFSAFDLLVALMLGEIVDEIIYADVRFIQGAVVMVTLGAVAYAESLLRSEERRVGKEGRYRRSPYVCNKRYRRYVMEVISNKYV